MKSFMMNAEVGDDVFEDDPTVIQLEEMAANMFGRSWIVLSIWHDD